MKDLNFYSEPVLNESSGADACIWCAGNILEDKSLEVNYRLAFGNVFAKTLPEGKKKFRYIHLSGATTERNQDRPLWLRAKIRRLKDQDEQNMLSFVTKPETQGLWGTLIVKPGLVIQIEMKNLSDFMGWMTWSKLCIRVDELAATIIDAGMNGWKENTLQDTEAMGTRGREILSKLS